ncbi:hypothetical protein TB1_040442 [Malus domestica]
MGSTWVATRPHLYRGFQKFQALQAELGLSGFCKNKEKKLVRIMDKKIRGMRVLESGAGQREDFGGGIKGRALELPCIAEDVDDHTGFGAFATVALCRHKVDGSDYAGSVLPFLPFSCSDLPLFTFLFFYSLSVSLSSFSFRFSHPRTEERWKIRALPFASTDFSISLELRIASLCMKEIVNPAETLGFLFFDSIRIGFSPTKSSGFWGEGERGMLRSGLSNGEDEKQLQESGNGDPAAAYSSRSV